MIYQLYLMTTHGGRSARLGIGIPFEASSEQAAQLEAARRLRRMRMSGQFEVAELTDHDGGCLCPECNVRNRNEQLQLLAIPAESTR